VAIVGQFAVEAGFGQIHVLLSRGSKSNSVSAEH